MDVDQLRLALCQIAPVVGDLEGNARRIEEAAASAASQAAHVAVFPELALVGYPAKDLLDRPSFVEAVERAVERLAAALPPELVCLVGAVRRRRGGPGPENENVVHVLRGGVVAGTVVKRLLPTYDVFDEARWFAPGTAPGLVEVHGVRLGITICEDIWNHVEHPLATRRYAVDPVAEVVAAGADVVLNLAASPFTRGKLHGRAELLAAVARSVGRPVITVNQVGGHDDLVFDGGSASFAADGTLRARLRSFETDLAVVSPGVAGVVEPRPTREADAVLEALTLGVRDFFARCGVSRALVGLSGGLDSALVAAIAARALGPSNVVGLAMPSRYSSQHSLDDAEALARALGITYRVVPIEPMFGAASEALAPHLDALGAPLPGDVTYENVQARLRCITLMAAANRLSAMVLNTGNKSEIACGYCTLYGDMAGGLAVIGDLFKTFAYEVARAVNEQAGREVIPESTLTKPPSAELRPDQKDADSLPEYPVLDPVLAALVERGLGIEEAVAEGFDRALVERVARLLRISEHKRRQLPPALVVTGKAFAIGRRFPIAQRYPG